MPGSPLHRFQFPFAAMGTPCDVQLYAATESEARHAAAHVIDDVRRLEAKYSRYRDDSLLADINRVAASGGAIEVDAETGALLDYAQACYTQSDGLFDISSGILRRAWRLDRGQLPAAGQVDALLARVGWHRLRWERPLLHFPVPGMELDLGGIVKEYAADRAVNLCREQGIGHAVVNLGGDIGVVGPHADGRPWRIGITHPRRPGTTIHHLELAQGALASSGDYARCIELDGRRYGHVLHPRTGWPVDHLAAVSVAGDLCVVCGSAATIAMLKQDQGPAWLQALGLPHYWVDLDGHTGGNLSL